MVKSVVLCSDRLGHVAVDYFMGILPAILLKRLVQRNDRKNGVRYLLCQE